MTTTAVAEQAVQREQVWIPRVQLEFHPANRLFRNDERFQELVASIREVGLLQPIVVRRVGDHWQVLAGERRVRACGAAEIDMIPALEKQVDDATALRIMVTENLQRKDLHPLDGGTPMDDAVRLTGKSAKWIARRAKLRDLVPEWRAAVFPEADASGKKGKKKGGPRVDLSRWSAAHLEVIARFPKEAQLAFLEDFGNQWNAPNWSSADVERAVESRMRVVSKAPWKASDESLLPAAGSCVACQKRSSCAQDLFDGGVGKDDRCLDETCWDRKVAAHVMRRFAALEEEHGNKLLLIRGGGGDVPEGLRGKKVEESWHFDRAKKSDPSAVPAMIVTGDCVGEVRWMKPWGGSSSTSARSAKPAGPKSLAQKKKELEGLRERIVLREFLTEVEKFAKAEIPNILTDREVIRVAAVFGTAEKASAPPVHLPRSEKALLKDLMVVTTSAPDMKRLWHLSLRTVCERLDTALHIKRPEMELVNWLAALLRIDLEPLWDKARAEKPTPRSWAKEEAAEKLKASKSKPKPKGTGTGKKNSHRGKEKKRGAGAAKGKGRKAAAKSKDVRRCRVCGCTDDDCSQCVEVTGEPCHWIEDDLCSACEGEVT